MVSGGHKNPEVKLHITVNGDKFGEADIQLGEEENYFSMGVSKYLGQEIEIKSDVEEEKLRHILCKNEKVPCEYPFRPQLHFTTGRGWINDPNGTVAEQLENQESLRCCFSILLREETVTRRYFTIRKATLT